MSKIYRIVLSGNWNRKNVTAHNFPDACKKAVKFLKEETIKAEDLDIESIELIAESDE